MTLQAQDIFDKVAKHLLTQNAKSENAEGMCMYRGPGELRCAAGWIIPDNLYNSKMETRRMYAVFSDFPKVAEYLGRENSELVQRLQDVHDQEPVEYWPTALKVVAEKFELSTNVVDKEEL